MISSIINIQVNPRCYKCEVTSYYLKGTTLTIAANTPAGIYTVVVRVEADGNENYSSSTKDSEVTLTVGKAHNPAAVAGTAAVMRGGNTVDLAGNVMLNGATGAVSYAFSGDANGCSLNGSVLTSGADMGSVTVIVSVAADGNYNASVAMPITVTISDKNIQTITASDVSIAYGDVNKRVNATTTGDGTIRYAVKEGSGDYIDVDTATGALTIRKAGTAAVVVTAAETQTYLQATKEVTVTIGKTAAFAATVTANELTYNGQPQELLTVDKSILVGGRMLYAIGTDAIAAPDDDLFTTSVPTGTDAGTYFVWYKVEGDLNHSDMEAVCLSVIVSPADPATPVTVTYSNTGGNGSTWTKGSMTTLDFIFKSSVNDASTFEHFTGIKVDDKGVDAINYTAEAGNDASKTNTATSSLTSTTPRTGDETDMTLWIVLLGASLAGLLLAIRKRRRADS